MTRTRLAPLAFLFALSLALFAPRATAQDEQSLNDLRRENDDLRQRIAQSDAQLAEARREIARLEAELAELKKRLDAAPPVPAANPGATPNTPGADAPPPAKDPLATLPDNDPFSSPEALLKELKTQYQTTFGGYAMDTPEQRRNAAPEIRRWVGKIGRESRGEIDWLIRLESGPQEDSRGRPFVEIVVLDPITGLKYDEQSILTADKRLIREINGRPEETYWQISGEVRAEPIFNENRIDPGMFDRPRFIGVMAEFGILLTVRKAEPAIPPAPPIPAPAQMPGATPPPTQTPTPAPTR